MTNGKLSIHVTGDELGQDIVRVNFNERTFEVSGYKHRHVIEKVISAAIRSCLDAVPEEEEKLPF